MTTFSGPDGPHEPCAERLEAVGIVPVVVLDRVQDAAPLAEALLAGGLPLAEVTYRTDAAPEAIAAMSALPGMLVGAGTVLTTEQADSAIAAGARFVVSPGFSPTVVAHCHTLQVPVFPGVATASEVQQAFEAGLRTVKFFPAERIGGVRALRAIAKPYGMMRFIPTGGISAANAAEYLADAAVRAVGGSWMVPRSAIAKGRFDEITTLAQQAVGLAGDARR